MVTSLLTPEKYTVCSAYIHVCLDQSHLIHAQLHNYHVHTSVTDTEGVGGGGGVEIIITFNFDLCKNVTKHM